MQFARPELNVSGFVGDLRRTVRFINVTESQFAYIPGRRSGVECGAAGTLFKGARVVPVSRMEFNQRDFN